MLHSLAAAIATPRLALRPLTPQLSATAPPTTAPEFAGSRGWQAQRRHRRELPALTPRPSRRDRHQWRIFQHRQQRAMQPAAAADTPSCAFPSCASPHPSRPAGVVSGAGVSTASPPAASAPGVVAQCGGAPPPTSSAALNVAAPRCGKGAPAPMSLLTDGCTPGPETWQPSHAGAGTAPELVAAAWGAFGTVVAQSPNALSAALIAGAKYTWQPDGNAHIQ